MLTCAACSRYSYISLLALQVGDPLKDTSGPSLNILIKLSAIISLVFAPAFPTLAEGTNGNNT